MRVKSKETSLEKLPDILNVEEFIGWARISRVTFYKEVKQGRIKIRKVGKRTLIAKNDAVKWFQDLPTDLDNLWWRTPQNNPTNQAKQAD